MVTLVTFPSVALPLEQHDRRELQIGVQVGVMSEDVIVPKLRVPFTIPVTLSSALANNAVVQVGARLEYRWE